MNDIKNANGRGGIMGALNTFFVKKLFGGQRKFLPLFITGCVFILMLTVASIIFPRFLSVQMFLNLFTNNAYLCLVAVGMTLVIISGGIDLSVGGVLAFTTMLSAFLLGKGVSPAVVIPSVLLIGALYGCFLGTLIHYFKLQPFIVTLAGYYLARGMAFVISTDSLPVTDPFYGALANFRVPETGPTYFKIGLIVFLVIIGLTIFITQYTKFGRSVYAIGGNEQSAVLMGMPVGRNKVFIYGFSGLCSALAGVVFMFFTQSGYAWHGDGMELEAISAVVIGGTLLTGGVGYVAGTMVGVLILGSIQSILRAGNIMSWWIRIMIGVLFFVFCLVQRFFDRKQR